MVQEWLEIISLVASIASLVLAVAAIWLSIVFYRMSVQASKTIDDLTHEIKGSVDRLDKLFNVMYRDTFKIVSDTVEDMRSRVWTKSSLDEDVAQREEQLKERISQEIKLVLDEQGVKNAESQGKLTKKLEEVFERAISTNTDSLRNNILECIELVGPVSVGILCRLFKVEFFDMCTTYIDPLEEKGLIRVLRAQKDTVGEETLVEARPKMPKYEIKV